MSQWVRVVLIAQLVIVGAMVQFNRLGAQGIEYRETSQAVVNERLSGRQDALESRTAQQEAVHASERLSVVESTLGELQWWARAIAVAVIGQLALTFSATRRMKSFTQEARR